MNELERIQKRIRESGLTPYRISQLTEISQSALGKILNGKVKKLNPATERVLNNFFDSYQGNSNRKLMEVGAYKKETEKIGENRFIIVGNTKAMFVPFIKQDARGEFLHQYDKNEFLEELPLYSFTVNDFLKGKYFAFEMVGDCMDNGTEESIKDKDIMVAREIQKNQWESRFFFENVADYVIIHKEGILVKRVSGKNDKGEIICLSLNKEKYAELVIPLEEINMILIITKVTKNR